MELLTHFRQTFVVHISDHIHKWWQHQSLCKSKVNDQVLLYLFLKSLTADISKDMAWKNPISEEDIISKAQQLELIYTQAGYIYNILSNASRLQTYKEFPSTSNSVDGLIWSLTQSNPDSNVQNSTYTYDSTHKKPQLDYQIHHMPSKNLTKRTSSYHHQHGGPCPPTHGTYYVDIHDDERAPP